MSLAPYDKICTALKLKSTITKTDDFNTFYYSTDLKYRQAYARQLVKTWHALKFIHDGSKVLDIGCGNGDIGRLIKDNDLDAEYYPVDIKFRSKINPTKTTPIEINLCKDSLFTKIETMNLVGKFDTIIIYDFIQSINEESGNKLLKDVYKISTPKTVISICVRTGKYVYPYEETSFLYSPDWNKLSQFLINDCHFRISETYGLRYGYGSDAIEDLSKKYENNALFNKIHSFLPNEISRNILGLCDIEEAKFILADLKARKEVNK